MGGSLILAKEKNIKITLVIVTDGSQGGDKAKYYPVTCGYIGCLIWY
jgi:hypothetical protein